jgi:peptidyl-prolyl cis-trans isomerase A (cyclophilin A)
MRSLATYLTPASLALLTCALAAPLGCDSPPEPVPEPRPVGTTKPQAAAPSGMLQSKPPGGQAQERPKITPPKPGKKKVSAKPTAEVKVSEDDPIKGKWSLEDATKGLPKGDALVATIETDMGSLECTLFPDKAPITVANFIGLARGTRPWKNPDGKWVKEPAYDGTPFHRIIKGFMIQGGDAKKNGSGEAGYVIPDEVWEDANHDRPGLLCMANRGPNTNSAQFFITDEAAFHLDYDANNPRSSGYTIFGECSPVDLVHKIASVEMARGDQPKTPPVIKKVSITRKKAEKKDEADKAKTEGADKEKAAPTEKDNDAAGKPATTKTTGKPSTASDAKAPAPPGPRAPLPTE